MFASRTQTAMRSSYVNMALTCVTTSPAFTGTPGPSVATFNATVAGPYRIEAAGTAPPGTTLAVGDTFFTSVLGYGLGALATLLLGVGGGLTLVIVTAARRSRARRAP